MKNRVLIIDVIRNLQELHLLKNKMLFVKF